MADYVLSAELQLKDNFSTKISSINKASEKFKKHMGSSASSLNRFENKIKGLTGISRIFGNNFVKYFGDKVKTSVNVGMSALNRFKDKMKSLVGNARNFGNKIGKNLSRGYNFTKKVGAGILKAGAVATGAGVYGVKAAGDFESLGARMNTAFQGNKRLAADYYKWANTFANATPFNNEEIIDATVRLKSYGYDPKRMMTMIGDMAAAYGKPLEQALEAYADAGQMEFERLKEFGITKDQVLDYAKKNGDAIKVSGERILDPNKFMKTLEKLIIERSKGGMVNLSKTLKGMFSTTAGLLKSNIAKLFGYDLNKNEVRVGSLLDRVKQKFEKFNSWMQSKEGQATFDKWVKAFDDALPQIIKIANAIKDKFNELAGENFVDKLTNSIKNFDPKNFNQGLDSIKDKFNELLDKGKRFAGIILGIQLGKVFGLKGMLAGAVIGGFAPELMAVWENLNNPDSKLGKMFGDGFSAENKHSEDLLKFQLDETNLQIDFFRDIQEKEKYHELLTQESTYNNETFENKIKNQNAYNYNTQNSNIIENYDNSYNSKITNATEAYYSTVEKIMNDNRKSLEKNFSNSQNYFDKSYSSNYQNMVDKFSSNSTIFNKKWESVNSQYNEWNRSNKFYNKWSRLNNKQFWLNNNTNSSSSTESYFNNDNLSNEVAQAVWNEETQKFISKFEINKDYSNNTNSQSINDISMDNSSLSNINKSNVIAFDKDIKVDVNIDFKGSHLTLENYEEKIQKAVDTSIKNSFDSVFKQISDGFNFGGSLI